MKKISTHTAKYLFYSLFSFVSNSIIYLGCYIPQVQVDGADVRNKLLGLEVKLTEVLDFKGTHLRTHQMLQEVVKHGDDPLSQEGVHKDPLDLWKQGKW